MASRSTGRSRSTIRAALFSAAVVAAEAAACAHQSAPAHGARRTLRRAPEAAAVAPIPRQVAQAARTTAGPRAMQGMGARPQQRVRAALAFNMFSRMAIPPAQEEMA